MRSKNWKKVVLACAVMVIFAGCGNNDTSGTGENPTAQEAENKKQESKESPATIVFDNANEESKDTNNTDDSKSDAKTEEDAVAESSLSDGKFDYVAFGNSVTIHEINELWWGNWGMAATTAEKDYVHILSKWLDEQISEPVSTTVVSIQDWEVAPKRKKAMKQYDKYLNKDVDLITIQTGENITEGKETLDVDYPALFKRIKKKAPNAQIVVLGELLWPKEEIESAKHYACEKHNIPFIEMTEFLNGYEEEKYRSKLGAQVAGADGSLHEIDNEVVAAHPNDAGMECIAETVKGYITLPK